MTNTRRNTIVLSSLLLSVVIGTLFITKSSDSKIKEYTKKISLLKGQAAVLDNQISNIDSLKKEFALQQELLAQQSKLILNADNPTITYNYLLDLLYWMGKDISFDFSLSGKPTKGAEWNEYIISGRSHFGNLVDFVNNIEYQRALLTIEELSIGNDSIANSDTVSFSMVFRTHFNASGTDPSSVTPKAVGSIPVSTMLFKSRLFENARSVSGDMRLIDVENVTLVGLTDDRAFVRDSQGIIRILSVGDRVAYGFLSNINLAEGKAVFKVDLYGIPEDRSIFLKRK